MQSECRSSIARHIATDRVLLARIWDFLEFDDLNSAFQFAETRIKLQTVLKMGRELTQQTWLAELFEALKILDMTMIGSFSEEGCLAGYR